MHSNKTCDSSSTALQKGHLRSFNFRFSKRPVSIRIGATPHLNLQSADLWLGGRINLQYSSVLNSCLKVLYIRNLLRPFPDVPVVLFSVVNHSVMNKSIDVLSTSCVNENLCNGPDKSRSKLGLRDKNCFLTRKRSQSRSAGGRYIWDKSVS